MSVEVSKQKIAIKMKVKLDGHQIEQVYKFVYYNKRCEDEMKIAIDKNQFSLMKNILSNRKTTARSSAIFGQFY